MAQRRTKIVATLGPATDAEGRLDTLIAAGMDCARINCSHGDREELLRRSAEVRAASQRAGRPIAVLFDLQGPKIRLSGSTHERVFIAGERVRFAAEGRGVSGDLEVAFSDFVALVTPESSIIIGDGTPRFAVSSVREQHIEAIVSSPGSVGPRKGINITNANPLLPALTPKDEEDIATGVTAEADFFALSFVRHAKDVHDLRSRLLAQDSQARVIAKIEKKEAFENLDSIISAADGVMVARGDYGVEAGLAHVPLMQKETLRRAEGKLTIVATQLLESMVHAPEPTRAEVLDVHNAVAVDGTSAVMLSAETSVGDYPVEAVSMMAEIARVAEQSGISAPVNGYAVSPDSAIMHAAVALGHDTEAAAIIVPTSSGGTVRACARHRPHRPIIALCHHERVARQLALEWGVHPAPMRLTENTDELIEMALTGAKSFDGLCSGDRVVITTGPATGRAGATNIITLKTLT